MNQPRKSVAFHIGAHKTATTHLQRSFMLQRAALNKAGVRYYGPDSLRAPMCGIADLFGVDVGQAEITPKRTGPEQREFMLKDGHRLVLSEENYIGVLHDREGRILTPLYPRAQERVAALADAVDAGPIDVLIGVRNPASFLISSYGQALMGGLRISFDEYLAMNPLSAINWAGLVARISAIPMVGRIVVWQFEEYRWRFHKICGAMMGDDVQMRIKPIPEAVHRGLSAAAVQSALAQEKTDDFSAIVEAARDRFPICDAQLKFAPFPPEDLERAERDYHAQLAAIDAIEGVTILRS